MSLEEETRWPNGPVLIPDNALRELCSEVNMQQLKQKTQVQLLNEDEMHIKFIKRFDAQSRVDRGEALWISRNRVQLKANSRHSATCLTAADSERLAGLRTCSVEQLSRIDFVRSLVEQGTLSQIG